jgi:hypothetical protein
MSAANDVPIKKTREKKQSWDSFLALNKDRIKTK